MVDAHEHLGHRISDRGHRSLKRGYQGGLEQSRNAVLGVKA